MRTQLGLGSRFRKSLDRIWHMRIMFSVNDERPGPGRPRMDPDSETKQVQIKAPASLWDQVDSIAADRGETRAEWVREACRQRLRRQRGKR